MYCFLIYMFYTVIMSAFAIFLYAKDKKLSVNGDERISEKALLAVAVFGGALGAFAGRTLFSHKTRKIYFSVVIGVSLFLQTVVFLAALCSALMIISGV